MRKQERKRKTWKDSIKKFVAKIKKNRTSLFLRFQKLKPLITRGTILFLLNQSFLLISLNYESAKYFRKPKFPQTICFFLFFLKQKKRKIIVFKWIVSKVSINFFQKTNWISQQKFHRSTCKRPILIEIPRE